MYLAWCAMHAQSYDSEVDFARTAEGSRRGVLNRVATRVTYLLYMYIVRLAKAGREYGKPSVFYHAARCSRGEREAKSVHFWI